ncbi:FGGY-family carbohydrate kinase [Schaalia sp. lx-260]|uniref:FGGY-family carbohydrate kinase n=1 Tax=Schaalia sp. lx-260 TaxID=2899082 RepID=UPI001E478CF4|nr:FGGY-family carbohydrate kinase [Schaalia sp. lx-260]MCD4549031.1 xylulose kinase [Schaalia sp. lx-260]
MHNTEGPYLLGIDFGTESCRVAICDLNGHPLTFAATAYRTYYPRPGWAEQKPEDWWQALQASTHKALAAAGIPTSSIAGISYDATTLTMVVMDEKGEELCPAIMWMDVRATEQAKRAEQSESVARLYNGGGTSPAIAEWLPFKAAWLRENKPEIWAKAAHIVDAPDWVTYKLTGEWTININSAAHRMYYNRDRGGWPVDFYETIGCGDIFDKLPTRVEDIGRQIGTLGLIPAQLLGLRPGIPVAQGPADAWAGQIGLGVLNPGSAALITGSSHVLSAQSATEIHGKGFFGAYTDGVVPGQYTVEGGGVSTGSVLKWFKDNFAADLVAAAEKVGLNPYKVLDEQAANIPPGCDGLVINEYFQGNRTPYSDSRARGIISGLSLMHTPAHIYRAIMEAVCYGTAHNIKAMEAAGFSINKMVACGGATKSRDWIQMHADVSGAPISLTEVGDAVALGTCMAAAVGAGFYSDLQEAAQHMVHEIDVLEPNQELHEEYQFFLGRYMDNYAALQESIHKTVDHLA